MRAWLQTVRESLGASLWFVPSVMAVLAAALAFVTVSLDQSAAGRALKSALWLYTGDADGARQVLATVAASMIGIAGVAFSVTIVALSLAAQQLGPRLLRNFMRDRGNQVVLGTFTATFIYCVLVLRTIEGEVFGLHLSVSVGVGLGMANLGVLIYFIHHVSLLIQASTVIAAVAADLEAAITRLFPERIAHGAAAPGPADLPEGFEREAVSIDAPATGYVQRLDVDRLLGIAAERDLIVKIERRPGHFVVRGGEVARAWPGGRGQDGLSRALRGVFVIGDRRTPSQDTEFAVSQLVDISLRALSPGINDPNTAMACIDRLAAALSRLAEREIPSPHRHDDHRRLRVVAEPVTYAGITDAAFNQIRQAAVGRADVSVMIRLLEAIATIGRRVRNDEFRAALQRQAVMIERGSCAAVQEEGDRRDIRERYEAAVRALRLS